jgi:hypothetical protein
LRRTISAAALAVQDFWFNGGSDSAHAGGGR